MTPKHTLWAQLCAEFKDDAVSMLMMMGNCNERTNPQWLKHVKFQWKNRDPKNPGLRERITIWLDQPLTRGVGVGLREKFFQSIWDDPRWIAFQKLRTKAYVKTPKGKKSRKRTNHKYNASHLRVLTLEQKIARNARDRQRYADRKLQEMVLNQV